MATEYISMFAKLYKELRRLLELNAIIKFLVNLSLVRSLISLGGHASVFTIDLDVTMTAVPGSLLSKPQSGTSCNFTRSDSNTPP